MNKLLVLAGLAVGVVGLSACEVVPEHPSMLIKTEPSEAQLTFDTGFVCTSPCKVVLRTPMRVKIAKAGYKAQEKILSQTVSGEVIWVLELAAPTTNVEEESLPEL